MTMAADMRCPQYGLNLDAAPFSYSVQAVRRPLGRSVECACGAAIEADKRIVDAQVDCVAFGVDGVVVVAFVCGARPSPSPWMGPMLCRPPCMHLGIFVVAMHRVTGDANGPER